MRAKGLFALVLAAVAEVSAADGDLAGRIDKLAQRVRVDHRVPGLAIAAVLNDEPILVRGYGRRSVDLTGEVDENTLFATGSLTTTFTATALAILVERGSVGWQDHVSKHVPEWAVEDPYVTRHATIADLARHSLGLEDGRALWAWCGYPRTEILKRMNKLRNERAFGRYAYSSLGYLVAGEIVERVSQIPWERFIAEEILAPLGMTGTKTTFTESQAAANRAVGHAETHEGVHIIGASEVPVASALSISSSASDLATWLRSQWRSRAQGRIKVSLDTLQVPHVPVGWEDEDVFVAQGLGWEIVLQRGLKIVRHRGGTDGFGCFVAFVPELESGVAVVTNLEFSAASSALGMEVLRLLARVQGRTIRVPQYLVEPVSLPLGRKQARVKLPIEAKRLTGFWEHPLLGDAKAEWRDGTLWLQLGKRECPLKHETLLTFRLQMEPASPPLWVTFHPRGGLVESVQVSARHGRSVHFRMTERTLDSLIESKEKELEPR